MAFRENRRRHRIGGSRGRNAGAVLGVALVGVLALLPGTAAAVTNYPPVVGPAVRTPTGFELKGTVYKYYGATTWYFEYGTTTAYGTAVPMPEGTAPSLFTPVSEQITGLLPNTTYHFRLVQKDTEEGTQVSADGTFSTAEAPPTEPPPTGGGNPPPGGGTGGGGGGGTGGGGTKPTNPAPGGGGGGSNPYPGGGGSNETYPGTPAGSEGPAVTGKGPKTVAKAVRGDGKNLLSTMKGRTLYTLSAETHGKFICTEESGCTQIWVPLTVTSGVIPKGPVKLGTVKRPEGQIQVTYRGHPLYTFASDKKPGQDKGEGLKDVGTWHAALVPTKH